MRSLSAIEFTRLELGCSVPIILFVGCRAVLKLMPASQGLGTPFETLLLGGSRWLLLGACLVALLYGRSHRRWGRAFVYGLVALVLAGVPEVGAPEEGLRLVSANLQAYSEEGAAPMEEALSALEADVLVTLEKRAETLTEMVRVADNFEEDLARPSHGTAVFCRTGVSCEAVVTPAYGISTCVMPVALVRVEERLCVVGLHLPPPVGLCDAGRRPYMDEVVSHLHEGRLSGDWGVCRKSDPVVLVGDLNTLEGGDVWREFMALGFQDPQRWRGIFGTSWPAGGGWPNLPMLRLDHLLLGKGLSANHIGYLRIPDSDHKALVAWLDVSALGAVTGSAASP
ncbi:MAG: endonuclease/exonuclease/phosphatase family protein [Myxococcota bacterium]|nr:endonuclease/exonuclease/phosphatase family protein [Myxococcota bacterium]